MFWNLAKPVIVIFEKFRKQFSEIVEFLCGVQTESLCEYRATPFVIDLLKMQPTISPLFILNCLNLNQSPLWFDTLFFFLYKMTRLILHLCMCFTWLSESFFIRIDVMKENEKKNQIIWAQKFAYSTHFYWKLILKYIRLY